MATKMMAKVERQLTFVADLNKCVGCQTCTIACKKSWTSNPGQEYMYWRNVETAPGQGYPRNWRAKGGGFLDGELAPSSRPALADYGIPFEFDYEGRLFEGKPGRARPSPTPRSAPNWDEDQGAGAYPNNHYFYLPRMCNHCDNPACLQACPNDAIYKRASDGLTIINTELCKGSQACVSACPYAKPYFNAAMQKANKCIGCYPRVEKGVSPACVAQCAGRAMHVGFIDDPASSVHKLVKVWKVALPLYPGRGTKPNVFYVPPLLGPAKEAADGTLLNEPKIPTELLREMFGADLDPALARLREERAKKMDRQPSELMDLLIGFRSAEMMLSPLT